MRVCYLKFVDCCEKSKYRLVQVYTSMFEGKEENRRVRIAQHRKTPVQGRGVSETVDQEMFNRSRSESRRIWFHVMSCQVDYLFQTPLYKSA